MPHFRDKEVKAPKDLSFSRRGRQDPNPGAHALNQFTIPCHAARLQSTHPSGRFQGTLFQLPGVTGGHLGVLWCQGAGWRGSGASWCRLKGRALCVVLICKCSKLLSQRSLHNDSLWEEAGSAGLLLCCGEDDQGLYLFSDLSVPSKLGVR